MDIRSEKVKELELVNSEFDSLNMGEYKHYQLIGAQFDI